MQEHMTDVYNLPMTMTMMKKKGTFSRQQFLNRPSPLLVRCLILTNKSTNLQQITDTHEQSKFVTYGLIIKKYNKN